MTNDELLKSNSLDEKTKLGMARFGVKEKRESLQNKQDKLLKLYNEFFKDKKVNSVDLKKMNKKYVILCFFVVLTLYGGMLISASMASKIIDTLSGDTINEFSRNFLENIGLFKTELISLIPCLTGIVLGMDSKSKISKKIDIYIDNNVFNTNHYEREELLTYIKENDSQIAKLDSDYKELSMQISELDKSREKSETKEFFEFDPIKKIQVDEEERKQKIQGQYREHNGRLVPQSGIYSDIEGESELEQAMNPLHAKPDSYYQNVYGCSCEEYVKRKTLKR